MHEQYACISCNCHSLDPISIHTNATELWPIYKAKYNKTYPPAEDKKHFAVFKENVKKIAEHNQKYDRGEEQSFKAIGRGVDGDGDDDAGKSGDDHSKKPENDDKHMDKNKDAAEKPNDDTKQGHEN